MATAFLIELPDMSSDQAAAVLQALDLGGKPPAGQVLHLEGPMEGGGTRVVDVWESPEALETFIRERLGPIMLDLGVQPPQPTLTWPVLAVLK